MRFALSTKSRKRSLGPVDGPSGSYEVPSAGPAGPVWPEWLKYGPIETITGVLASPAEVGRRMSACSCTPPVEGIVVWVQVAPAGTSAAEARAGVADSATTPSARAMEKRMTAATQLEANPCGRATQSCQPKLIDVQLGRSRS